MAKAAACLNTLTDRTPGLAVQRLLVVHGTRVRCVCCAVWTTCALLCGSQPTIMFTACKRPTQLTYSSRATTTHHSIAYTRCAVLRRSVPEGYSVALSTSTPTATASGLRSIDSAAVLNETDLEKAKQGIAVLQQYGGQAADAAGAALQGLFSPFHIFGDSWFLNFMFFGILGLLAYSLLILAPRQ